MAISSVSISPPSSNTIRSVTNNTAPRIIDNTNKPNNNNQASAIVSLSAKGINLNQGVDQNSSLQVSNSSSSNRPGSAVTENAESANKETSEAPGIQFIEGERKGGRINIVA